MSTLQITIKSPDTAATLRSQFQKNSSSSSLEASVLANYFQSIASGTKSAQFEVNTASAHPVKASGTITATYASVANNDTVTIAGVVFTCVTGTPSGEAQYKKETDGPTTIQNLLVKVNAHSTIGNIITASRSGSVLTLTAKVAGEIGNFLSLASSNGTGQAVSGTYLASGAGGGTGTSTSYSRGY
jgi:phage tail sheath gpL-like